jgi:2-polyprenyl-3-methyl-5-hydroxy-6-metoxy-1,4-benzoquinol methylase
MHVIEHVVDPLIFLKSAFDNVKPGGYAFIATPNSRSLIHRMLKKSSPNYDEAHLRVFSIQSLLKISKLSGWEVVNVSTPEFSLDWLRVLSKFFRRLRQEDESLTAGKYASNSSKLMLFCIQSFDLISYPIRKILHYFGLGNELFIVLKRPS